MDNSIEQRHVVIGTGSGKLRGVATGSVAFRGVPYARSPIGELRFAAPQPHPGWTRIRDAIEAGPAAPQWPSRLEAVMGTRLPDWSEHGCLNLNIWTPDDDFGAARPVLLWFHGGGFTSGSGGWDWYDGGRLAALGGIVVVTANYRLGPLGYLYLPEFGADNLGTQDQAAALRWVVDNIAAFGGDPGSITVGGQSAGAFSALALAADPGTGGMVRRVIGQSGPWGMPPQDPGEAAGVAAKYLEILGISSDSQRLRELPVARLLAAYARLLADSARPGGIAPPMYPVRGGAGQAVGWPEALASGALADKDVLIGSTANEATSFLALNPIVQTADRDTAVRLLAERGGAARYDEYADRYPAAGPAELFTAIVGDLLCGTADLANGLVAQGNPTYVYRFMRGPAVDPYGFGAAHCAELPFLFGTFESYPNAPMLGTFGPADRVLAAEFGGALAAFVATGTPNGPALEPWQPYATDESIRYFRSAAAPAAG
ncbi:MULTISPECIES: carboxylesterase/lipase family protein [unclassified Nocardia]|uniref:carboxylesterase/lipase family protein n=1 Tax=unclassified Nocardia TaxID=2637762 RepID=UPI001CE47954|nr:MULTISPECIES: carboxylesterase family protein [unclassified Nocardia]